LYPTPVGAASSLRFTSDEIEEMVRDLIEEHLADDDAKAALKWLDKRVEAMPTLRR
jgi:hypothetical protein